MYSIDHNDIFDYMFCTEPGNLLNIYGILLKNQSLIKLVVNFKETRGYKTCSMLISAEHEIYPA